MRPMTSQPRDPWIGQLVGPDAGIVIVRLIGEGGSGRIYRGFDRKHERHVALKFLHPTYADHENLVARFRQEGERFDELDHPNVVKVYGFDQKGKHRFIIFEFVDGMNLYQLMKMRGSLALERALKIVREAAAGLAEAHRLGIVHRDLKPENIMIRNQDNVVKVLDFGIAKDLKANLELTGLGMYIGTPAYSSPEQIRGDKLDHRADIFSLGVILYELLTGKVAFDGRHSTEVLRSTLRDEPRPVSDLNRLVTAPVAALIETMIRKRPDRRLASMVEVMSAIDDVLGVAETVSDDDAVSVRHSLKELFE